MYKYQKDLSSFRQDMLQCIHWVEGLHHHLLQAFPGSTTSPVLIGNVILEYAYVCPRDYNPTAVISIIVYGPVHLIFIFAFHESSAVIFFKTLSPTERGLLKVLIL